MQNLSISQAQILYEMMQNPDVRAVLFAFFESQREEHTDMLITEVSKSTRDVLKEARLAGKVDGYATAFSELEYFAKRMVKEAQ